MTGIILLASILKILVVVGFTLLLAPVLTWMERRQSAMMQMRVGPNRAGIRLFGHDIRLAGLLHPLADALKMIFKEDFVPRNADKLLHALAPMLALFPPFVLLGVVPIADVLCLDSLRHDLWAAVPRFGVCSSGALVNALPAIPMQIVDTNVGILYVFALGGMGIIGATIAGWASDNKFSLLGGLRAASQLVSYEVAMGLSIVGCIMTYGSLRLDEAVRWQNEHAWGIFVQPLAFILFFTAAVAETKRAPFDLPEGESEIVAGYFLEYSGMKFGMFFLGEFVEVIVSSALVVTLFLGGYSLPFLHRDGLTVTIFGTTWLNVVLPHLVVILLQVLTFFGKVTVMCWFQLFVRWTLPRFRYDQLMSLGWRKLLPAALINVFVTGVVLIGLDRAGASVTATLDHAAELANLLVAGLMIAALLAMIIGFILPSKRFSHRIQLRARTNPALGA